MYDKAQWTTIDDGYRIDINSNAVEALRRDLKAAGFTVDREAGVVGYEDLNREDGREEVASLKLPPWTNEDEIKSFLRTWNRGRDRQ